MFTLALQVKPCSPAWVGSTRVDFEVSRARFRERVPPPRQQWCCSGLRAITAAPISMPGVRRATKVTQPRPARVIRRAWVAKPGCVQRSGQPSGASEGHVREGEQRRTQRRAHPVDSGAGARSRAGASDMSELVLVLPSGASVHSRCTTARAERQRKAPRRQLECVYFSCASTAVARRVESPTSPIQKCRAHAALHLVPARFRRGASKAGSVRCYSGGNSGLSKLSGAQQVFIVAL